MPFAMRRRTFFFRPWQQFGAMVLLGLLLGVIGPFGTFGREALESRLIHWLVLVIGNWLLIIGSGEVLLRLSPAGHWPPALQGAAAAALAALPATVMTAGLIGRWGWIEEAHLSLVETAFYVAALGQGISIPATILFHGLDDAPLADTPPTPCPFLDRIPVKLGRDLLAVEAEDHYLRVHTSLGSDLLLMRMGDAEKELDMMNGRRVHRSWWVARGAVASAKRHGQGLRLSLVNGCEVPVSRSRVGDLRRLGWLQPSGKEGSVVGGEGPTTPP